MRMSAFPNQVNTPRTRSERPLAAHSRRRQRMDLSKPWSRLWISASVARHPDFLVSRKLAVHSSHRPDPYETLSASCSISIYIIRVDLGDQYSTTH